MMKNVRWRLTLTALVIGLSVLAFYPPDRKINLGLDLKGGVHLVLRVQTDDALRLATEQEMERLRADLMTRGITVGNISSADSTHFTVESVPPAQDAAFRQAAADVQVSFDRSAGTNGTYTFTMKPNVQVTLREEA